MKNVKKKKEIYLIGYEEEKLVGCKLPTIRQVLGVFLYQYNTLKFPVRKSSSETIKEVQAFWKKAQIPIRRIVNIIKTLENVYDEWKRLRKSRSKKSPTQKEKEDDFQRRINGLFDIAEQNALERLTEDQRQFLQSQCQRT